MGQERVLGRVPAAPVLLFGGVVVAVNNSKVNREIVRRQTVLPINVEAGQSQKLDLFFPLVPSPRKVEVNCLCEGMGHQAIIDVSKTLEGLHLAR